MTVYKSAIGGNHPALYTPFIQFLNRHYLSPNRWITQNRPLLFFGNAASGAIQYISCYSATVIFNNCMFKIAPRATNYWSIRILGEYHPVLHSPYISFDSTTLFIIKLYKIAPRANTNNSDPSGEHQSVLHSPILIDFLRF